MSRMMFSAAFTHETHTHTHRLFQRASTARLFDGVRYCDFISLSLSLTHRVCECAVYSLSIYMAYSIKNDSTHCHRMALWCEYRKLVCVGGADK